MMQTVVIFKVKSHSIDIVLRQTRYMCSAFFMRSVCTERTIATILPGTGRPSGSTHGTSILQGLSGQVESNNHKCHPNKRAMARTGAGQMKG